MPEQGSTSGLVDLDWPGIAAGPQDEGQVDLLVCRMRSGSYRKRCGGVSRTVPRMTAGVRMSSEIRPVGSHG